MSTFNQSFSNLKVMLQNRQDAINQANVTLKKIKTSYEISGQEARQINSLTTFINNSAVKLRDDYDSTNNNLAEFMQSIFIKWFTYSLSEQDKIEAIKFVIEYNRNIAQFVHANILTEVFDLETVLDSDNQTSYTLSENSLASTLKKFIDRGVLNIIKNIDGVYNADNTISNVLTAEQLTLVKQNLENEYYKNISTILKKYIIDKILYFSLNDETNEQFNASDNIKAILSSYSPYLFSASELNTIFERPGTYEGTLLTSDEVLDMTTFTRNLFYISVSGTTYYFKYKDSVISLVEQFRGNVDTINQTTNAAEYIARNIVYIYKSHILKSLIIYNMYISNTAADKSSADGIDAEQIYGKNHVIFCNFNLAYSGETSAILSNIINTTSTLMPLGNAGTIIFSFIYKEFNSKYHNLLYYYVQEAIIANILLNSQLDRVFATTNANYYNSSFQLIYQSNVMDLPIYYVEPTYDIFTAIKYFSGNSYLAKQAQTGSIVGYFIGNYQTANTFVTSYGAQLYERQEIAIFLDIYEQCRSYYYKVLLLQSLLLEDTYPLYEFLLITSIAIDRFFTVKLEDQFNFDAYTPEDIKVFFDSFGLGDLNTNTTFANEHYYKQQIAKNYNLLLKNKGTRFAINLLYRIYNNSNATFNLNKYFLVEETSNSITTSQETIKSFKFDFTRASEEEADSLLDDQINYSVDIPEDLLDTLEKTAGVIGYFDNTTRESFAKFNNDETFAFQLTKDIRRVKITLKSLNVDETAQLEVYYGVDEATTSTGTPMQVYDIEYTTQPITITFDEMPVGTKYIMLQAKKVLAVFGLEIEYCHDPEQGNFSYNNENSDLVFVRVPFDSEDYVKEINTALLSNSKTPYNTFIKDDPYWRKTLYEEDLKKLNINYIETKYLDFDMNEEIILSNIMKNYAFSAVDFIDNKFKNYMSAPSVVYEEFSLDKTDYTLYNVTANDVYKIIKFIIKTISIFKDIKNYDTIESGVSRTSYTLDRIHALKGGAGSSFYGYNSNINIDIFKDKLSAIFNVPKTSTLFEEYMHQNYSLNGTTVAGQYDVFDRYTKVASPRFIQVYQKVTPGQANKIIYTEQRKNTFNTLANLIHHNYFGATYVQDVNLNSGDEILDILDSLSILISGNSIPNVSGTLHPTVDNQDVLFSEYLRNYLVRNNNGYQNPIAGSENAYAYLDQHNNKFIALRELYTKHLSKLLSFTKSYYDGSLFEDKDAYYNYRYHQLIRLIRDTFLVTEENPLNTEYDNLIYTLDGSNNPEISSIALDNYPELLRDYVEDLRYVLNPDYIVNTTEISLMSDKWSTVVINLIEALNEVFGDNQMLKVFYSDSSSSNNTLSFLVYALQYFLSYKYHVYKTNVIKTINSTLDKARFSENIEFISEAGFGDNFFFDEKVVYEDIPE